MGVTGAAGSSVPAGDDWIKQELRELRRRLDELASADVLRTAGMETEPDLLRVVGSLNTTGAMDVDGTMNVDGDATFAGSVSITGPLELNPGSIPNDWLLNPLTPGSNYNSVAGYGLTTTQSTIVSTTLTVPAGFTKAYVTGLGTAYFVNPTPNVEYVYARVYIEAPGQSWWGARPLSLVGPNNGSANLSPNRIVTMTGLTGGQTITVSLRGFVDFNAMSFASNFGTIDTGCIFFR